MVEGRRALSPSSPYRCGAPLEAEAFARLRREMVLEHCKWDPQVGDTSTLASFPLVLSRAAWRELAGWAEALSAEASSAERELAERPELQRRLGLPRKLRSALEPRSEESLPEAPRAYRYDFHFTTDGWRISECNADVPGGYAESSAFPALMAEHYGLTPVGDPGAAWARAITRAAHTEDVALLSAAGFMEDSQVVHYLARQLRALGLRAHCVHPSHIAWRDGAAWLGGRSVGAVVRFYQAEWLTSLPASTGWYNYLHGGRTPVLNPGTCITIESKRFPLCWDELCTTSLPTWRELLPESVDPRHAPWQSDESWLLKTALCNTGDTVSVRALMSSDEWSKAARAARWFPTDWVAQRRFEPVPLTTPIGSVFPCIGVYTVDGRACGVYGRLSSGKVVDFTAVDVAVLLEDDHVAQA
jgi:glutathionylspermidine synthase